MSLWEENIAVIREQNPWWVSGTVPADLAGSVRRVYYETIIEHLASQREILLLEGPRRVGKTTLIYQTINRLLASVKPDHILYVSVDDPYLKRETLFKDIQGYFEHFVARQDLRSAHETFYVFLDEVTALEDWELYVKRYYDLKFPFRFVCTSSAAAFLKKRSRESLAGRISAIQVYPFCLSETIRLRGMGENLARAHARLRDVWAAFYGDPHIRRLHADLREVEREFGAVLLDELPTRLYLLEGGFPEYILAQSERYKDRYFLESVVDRTLFHDIGPVFGTTDLHLLQRLFLYSNNQSGALMNISEASRNLGAPYSTVASYLRCLSAAGLLYLLPKFASSVEAEAKSLERVYAIDPGLYLSLARIRPADLDRTGGWGRLAEISVLAELKRHDLRAIHYWRERDREVDFVVESGGALIAIEVKFGTGPLDLDREGFRGLEYFTRRFSPATRIIISRDTYELHDERTLVVPLRLFLG
ncbi:MAG TPA: ATP-binding protein [Firmicutes bacterium]|nr:ATP-binding protein [Bacillota bacterium]